MGHKPQLPNPKEHYVTADGVEGRRGLIVTEFFDGKRTELHMQFSSWSHPGKRRRFSYVRCTHKDGAKLFVATLRKLADIVEGFIDRLPDEPS